MEKLHEKNEDLVKENKKLEEMVKQLLLNREISRIRKLYPTIIENLPLSSNGKEENRGGKLEKIEFLEAKILSGNNGALGNNSENNRGKVKNVCLDLKEMLKGL